MTRAPALYRDRERPTPRHVLICEDDPGLARILARQVGRWTRSRPMKLTAGDADLVRRMAVEHIHALDPALVITDGLEGGAFDIARTCASLGIPCIVFTGEPDRYALCEAAVISKPDVGALEAAVGRALAARAA